MDCADKFVRVQGKKPAMIHQHPVLTGMSAPGAPRPQQDYLELPNGTQIIVLSNNPPSCSGPMRVTGTLRRIDMGGEPGTKESYKGWSIEQAEVVCE